MVTIRSPAFDFKREVDFGVCFEPQHLLGFIESEIEAGFKPGRFVPGDDLAVGRLIEHGERFLERFGDIGCFGVFGGQNF